MATRTVVVSDLSATEVDESQAATIVVTDHPNLTGPVELDATKDEVKKITPAKLELVTLKVYDGGKEPRNVVMDVKGFNALFASATAAGEALKSARKASVRGGARKASGPKAERIDYLAKENFGLIHRGKVTDEEAKLVRDNLEQANKNRAREGQVPVGDDPKDQQRYSLK